MPKKKKLTKQMVIDRILEILDPVKVVTPRRLQPRPSGTFSELVKRIKQEQEQEKTGVGVTAPPVVAKEGR